jgi:hypothetical protein
LSSSDEERVKVPALADPSPSTSPPSERSFASMSPLSSEAFATNTWKLPGIDLLPRCRDVR